MSRRLSHRIARFLAPRKSRDRTRTRVRPLEVLEPRTLLSSTWYVDSANTSGTEDGSAAYPYTTIQGAIDNTHTSAGDAILLESGNGYDETVMVNKSLTIEADAGQTPVNAGTGTGVGLTIASGVTGVTITGLTIEDFATGVVVEPGASLTLDSDTIENNINEGLTNSGDGGGVYDDGATLAIDGGTIEGNTALNGGGLYIAGGIVQITDSDFVSNKVRLYGGAINNVDGHVEITGGSIRSNIAAGTYGSGGGGGGISNGGGTLTIAGGALIQNNKAYSGGGLYIVGGTVHVTDSQVDSNSAVAYGGGIIEAQRENHDLRRHHLGQQSRIRRRNLQYIRQCACDWRLHDPWQHGGCRRRNLSGER